ncbi:MAG TPA: hypothetical protein VGH10_09160 [Actinomycetota bacterium]|jgi:hypothetical protein
MGADVVLPRERDADGSLHPIAARRCTNCSCTVRFALDDPSLVWEMGSDRSPGCQDEWCPCHLAPLFGERARPAPRSLPRAADPGGLAPTG